jgi:hypothetical protein
MKTADGKALFEKAAQLADIKLKQGLGGDFKAAHNREIQNFMQRQLEASKRMSNEDAIAERGRLTALSRMSGVSTGGIDGSILTRMEQQNASLTATVNGFDTIDANNIDAAKAASGLVADKFEVQFGQSITDALLQQSDIGLKGSIGDITLGVAPSQPGKMDESALNGMRMNKIQCDAKLKMEKMNLKIKKFELDKLQKKVDPTDAEKVEIQKLASAVSEGEREVGKYESEVTRIEMDIVAGGGSV